MKSKKETTNRVVRSVYLLDAGGDVKRGDPPLTPCSLRSASSAQHSSLGLSSFSARRSASAGASQLLFCLPVTPSSLPGPVALSADGKPPLLSDAHCARDALTEKGELRYRHLTRLSRRGVLSRQGGLRSAGCPLGRSLVQNSSSGRSRLRTYFCPCARDSHRTVGVVKRCCFILCVVRVCVLLS